MRATLLLRDPITLIISLGNYSEIIKVNPDKRKSFNSNNKNKRKKAKKRRMTVYGQMT